MEQIFDDFITIVGEPIYTELVPDEVIQKYEEVVMGPDDEEDILIAI